MGPIGSGWPQIGFKFKFNPIMYLINPNELDLKPISGRVGIVAKINFTYLMIEKHILFH